jgi:hypothetical protein
MKPKRSERVAEVQKFRVEIKRRPLQPMEVRVAGDCQKYQKHFLPVSGLDPVHVQAADHQLGSQADQANVVPKVTLQRQLKKRFIACIRCFGRLDKAAQQRVQVSS